jgi:flagellar motor switch protein FliN/FliY
MPSSPTAHVIALSDLHDTASSCPPEATIAESSDPPLLHRIQTRLQIRVGEALLSVGELMALRESEVLILDRDVDAPVDVLLEGHVVARGELVAVDDRFAVRVTELPLPLRP